MDMDYKQLFDRWVALTVLSEDERKRLVGTLHEEVRNGVEVLAVLAADEVKKILDNAQYAQREEYLKTLAPVLALAALDGYLLSLMERGINPETAVLSTKETTRGLGERWSRAYERDQNTSYLDNIDPIIALLLGRISDLRVNQLLALHSGIVELPYKVTEKIHQYVGWSVHQGYVLGVMEQDLAS